MALILRRAGAARGLLAAAAAVMIAAVLLLAGLTAYAEKAAETGMRDAIAAADPAERSVLVHGAGGAELAERDRKVRAAYAPATVSAARYGSGWAFTDKAGSAVPDADGVVYADLTALDDLGQHAELTSGAWPAGERDVALAAAAAKTLGVTSGETLRLTDRRTGKVVPLRVTGVWRARDTGDPYWLLVPDVFSGRTGQTATYGPLVLGGTGRLVADGSAGWLVRPDLAGASLDTLTTTAAAITATGADLPESTGLGTSATVTTGLPALADRLARADLVRRSTLVTPMLLVVVLGGYALSLVAALLAESRRGETALLRARGASRRQLARLAAVEAFGLLLPAGLLAPPLAVLLLRTLPLGGTAGETTLTPAVWLAGGLAVLGGLLALTAPALRRGGTYVAETAGRKRLPMLRRAGLDLVVVALAVLGWLQLRQYSAPVGAGGLGIDPLLAAAPTLGVLTGAVVAVRLLPPVARFAAARLNTGVARAALLGTWQAGRRSHAGPMVMLALAVAAATVSWCLAATAQQSRADQAVQRVGADVRLVETGGTAPTGRAAELAGLTGVRQVLPAWRDSVPLTAGQDPAELVALDTAAAAGVVQARDDATGGPPSALLARFPVASDTASLRPGTIITTGGPVRTTAVYTGGRHADLGVSDDGAPLTVAASGAGLIGFLVDGGDQRYLDWRITGQQDTWQRVGTDAPGDFAVSRPVSATPVPIAVTAAARAALGATGTLPVGGASVSVTVVAVVDRIPGTTGAAAILADRTALDERLFEGYGIVHGTGEWWISGHPGGLGELSGVEVLDQRETSDPFGDAARVALFVAAFGAVLLAAAGIAADARATARHRSVELAVLHTLGAGPRLLARSLVVEQAFLAGLGSLAGLGVGLVVSSVMAPLLVLTPSAGRPVPDAVPEIAWGRTVGSAVLLVVIALAVSATTAASATRRLPATRLRLGADQ
ncbi:ABC transporter permease [Actinoplanes sp. NPDC051851]|uniref:ABC transporter permease n=1 Tax=Actinoplanes sp. NPDC051851 TaxID=3154753 RepID=UPI00343F49BF